MQNAESPRDADERRCWAYKRCQILAFVTNVLRGGPNRGFVPWGVRYRRVLAFTAGIWYSIRWRSFASNGEIS